MGTTPEELARQLATLAKPVTEFTAASSLLDCLRKAQTYSSPAAMEPLKVFAAAGGVRALGAAMKANSPVSPGR